MKRHRHPGVAVCIGAVLGLLGTGAHAQTPEEALPVVRFGVLDPPVVAQRDVTVRAMTSNHPLDPEPKLLECSGMTAIGNRLILTSDRHAHGVFLLDIDPAAATVGEPQLEIIIGNEKNLLNDLESAASLRHADGSANVYLITSLSNDPEGEADITRRRWARFAVSAEGEVVPASTRMLDVQPLRDAVEEAFSALQVRAYHAYTPDENDNTDRWGNIEGIAFAPQGGLALLGFRNPLAGGEAIFATVRGVDEAFDRGDPELIELIDLFRLDLGGRGVSDLAWDPVTRGYLIAAGRNGGPRLSVDDAYPPDNLDYALFWWSGVKAEPAAMFATVADTNIDAICRVGDSPLIALGSDEGDVSENRAGRQSLITLYYFVGFE